MVENERHAGHACMMPPRVGMPPRMDVSWRRSEQRTVENERHAGMMPPLQFAGVGMPPPEYAGIRNQVNVNQRKSMENGKTISTESHGYSASFIRSTFVNH
jgi:hypothetical protein